MRSRKQILQEMKQFYEDIKNKRNIKNNNETSECSAKRTKLRENLNVGERVLVLAQRIKKKSVPGKFYKQSVHNVAYFNKEQVFFIRTKQKIDKITYYWLKNVKSNKFLTKRFQRNELFVLKNSFIV